MKFKNIFKISLLLFLLILLIVFYWVPNQNTSSFNEIENTSSSNEIENISIDIGNFLSDYFTQIGLSFLNQKDHVFKEIYCRYAITQPIENIKDINFVKHFPTTIPYRKDIYDEMVKSGLTYDNVRESFDKFYFGYGQSTWVIFDKTHESFWKCMKPFVNETLKAAFEKTNIRPTVEYPVIHFRCSDAPFIRNPNYLLQKYSFFKHALDKITEKTGKKFDKVIISFCNGHLSDMNDQKACNIYYDSLSNYLNSIGYKTIQKCSTNVEDFASMFFAPAVISTCSSFSFMSGFFSDGIFISEGHYTDKYVCDNCDEWLLHGYSIQHSEVENYHDTDSVIQKLKS